MKSNFATGNRLQETGNRLPESKNSGNLENFVKILLKNKTVLCLFFEKSFQYFPCEVFLISSLETWIHLFLNLEIKFLFDSWIVLDSILKSFSWDFCHHLCYHQNNLNQSGFNIMKLASTKGRRETQKEFRRLVLVEFFLAKGKENEKDE